MWYTLISVLLQEGFTALDVAIAKDRSEVQKELLKHKAMRGSEEHSEVIL